MKKIMLLLLIGGCCNTLSAGADYPASVHTDQAITVRIAPTTLIPGTVVGRYDSRIAAEAEGRLLKVVEVGDRLKEGDVIASIDSRTYEITIDEKSAELLPLKAELEFYEREAERLRKLAEQNNAAKNRLDEVRMNRDQTRGRISVIQARLTMAREELSRTTIKAPFDGIVVERFQSPGERVDAGDDVIRLVDTREREIQGRVPAFGRFHFQPGDTLRVQDNEREIMSRIRTVVPVGDDVSRLYELRLECNESDWTVGHAVEIAVPMAEPREVVAVHRDALVLRNDGVRVFRVNDQGLAELVPVTTGIADDSHIEVRGEINAGDIIVIRGNERLRPGRKVLIQNGPAVP